MSHVPPQRRARLGLWALILLPAAAVIWIGFKHISPSLPMGSAASDPTLTDKADPAPSPPSVELAAEAIETADASVHEATVQAILPPLPAAIAPHRAPAALRQQDRERFRDDPDLSAYAAELQARANAGDADAAMSLAELYGFCGMASEWGSGKTDFTAHELDMQTTSGMSATQTQQWKTLLLSNGRRCAQWRSQSPEEWSNLAAAWQRRAEQMGHPGAWFTAHPDLGMGPVSAELLERARPLALELLRQRDLDEMVRYADQLAPLSPYDGLGFVMAACLLNEACAPDPMAYADARIAAADIVGAGAYWPLTYSGPRALLIARQQAQEIVTLWRAGRFDLILSGRASTGPGGG